MEQSGEQGVVLLTLLWPGAVSPSGSANDLMDDRLRSTVAAC